MDYTNKLCSKCGKPFRPEDDVVVCPECGSPYHRACWEEAGGCINTALHQSGGSWQAQQDAQNQQRKECPRCHYQNLPDAAFCSGCGMPLQPTGTPESGEPQVEMAGVRIDPDQPLLGLNPEEDLGGATVAEMGDFVGSNQLYYLSLFTAMKRTGKKISFNAMALLFPHIFFVNRKMWLWTLLSLMVQFVLGIPSALLLMGQMEGFSLIANLFHTNTMLFQLLVSGCSLLDLAFSVFMCLYANYLYRQHAIRKITRLRARNYPLPQYREAIKRAGGTCLPLAIAFVLIWIMMQFYSTGMM